jgi:hypothetical protein
MTQHITVEIQQTDEHAALNVPRERLEALGHEVAQTGIEEWGIEDGTPRTIVLENKWGSTDTNIMVRRLSAMKFHVVFMTKTELRNISPWPMSDQPQKDHE